MTYFHNHRVTPQGQLIGMFCMEAPFAWYEIKNANKPLFKWLRDNSVYMKYVSFKADNVSAAGWLWNAHPDTLRRDEAMSELKQRLGDTLPKDLNFQLSARPLAVAMHPGSKDKFFYRGIAVECDRSRVQELQEAFYQLENPKIAKEKWSITGTVMFIPFLVTKAFPHSKLLGMAKAHVLEMGKLDQLFLQDIGDIDQTLHWKDGSEGTLRSVLTQATTDEGNSMIHSVHRTNKPNTILILYYKEYKEEVETLFLDIHELLENQLSSESYGKSFLEGAFIHMSGKQNEEVSSVASRAYSSYVDEILEGMNPQGGDAEEVIILSPPRKRQNQRQTPPRMTYSQATSVDTSQKAQKKRKARKKDSGVDKAKEPHASDSDSEEMANGNETITTMQERFALMEARFEERFGKVEGTDIETTKKLIEENNKEIQKSSEVFFEKKFEELSTSLTKEIQSSNELIFAKFAALHDQQNTVVHTLQEAVKHEFLKIYDNMLRIQAGKPIEHATFTVAGPGISQPQASDTRP